MSLSCIEHIIWIPAYWKNQLKHRSVAGMLTQKMHVKE